MEPRRRPYGLLVLLVAGMLIAAAGGAAASEDGAAAADTGAAPAAAAAGGAGELPPVRSFMQRVGELAIKYPAEAALLAVIALYLLAVIAGRRENYKHAADFSDAFAGPDGLLAQQFAAAGAIGRSGQGEALWWREGPASFKIWATGRRFCSGALISVETPPRQDMIRRLLPGQSEGRVDFEVIMREGCMAPMVLAVTPAKGLKALSKSNADVKDFAKRVELPKERFPLWPAGVGGKGAADLAALCESQSLFYDLFGDARVQQIIGKDPHLQKHLRQIVFSTEGSLGPPDRKLKFTMALPPPGQMDELRGILSLACLMIDIVGSYKLSADGQSKAAAARARVEAERAERRSKEEGGGGGGSKEERQMAAQMRRMEKLAEEREKARRAGPKALEKFEERMRKQQMKKAMKRNTVKMG